MNPRSAPPEMRMIVALTATAAVAAWALMPHRVRMGVAHVEAGIPFTYASWRGTTPTEFNAWALAVDVALLLVIAGFWVWRYWAVKREAESQERSEFLLWAVRKEHERQTPGKVAVQPTLPTSGSDREKPR